MYTAASYIRNSTKNQKDNLSVENYRRSNKAFIEGLKGTQLFGEFYDNVTGSKNADNRKKMKEVLQLLDDRVIDLVVVPRIDRTGREMTIIQEFIRLVYKKKGRVGVAEKGKVYESSFDCENDNFLDSIITEVEYKKIINNSQKGVMTALELGSFYNRPHYGYRLLSRLEQGVKFKYPAIDESQAVAVRMIIDLRNEDYNILEIAKQLTLSPYYTAEKNKDWSEATVLSILNNANLYNGESFEREVTFWKFRDGETRKVTLTYPKIISDDVYRAFKKKDALRTKITKTYDYDTPFLAYTFCNHCGKKVISGYRKKRKDNSFVFGFICATKNKMQVYKSLGREFNEDVCKSSIYSTKLSRHLYGLMFLDC
jgi:DNA invertase Pin-like site-specific DNA recombinase